YFEKFKYIITIDDTPNSLKITTDTLKKKFLTNFNYNNGILEYVFNPNLENSFSDFIWIGQALESFTNIKKYDYTDFNNWFGKQDQNALTIPKDGIELKTEKVEYDNGNGIATGDRFLVFKVDLVNGLKTYVPSVKTETKPETKVDVTVDTETTVTNPSTGLKYGIGGITLITIISGGCILYFKTKKANRFPKVK
ncbi:MAG: hypothetical protein RSE17_02035, partial [Bacilli bacterium]